MHRVLCSTGALIGRPNGRDYRLLAPCADKLRCDGYEFMMYSTWYDQTEELARFLKGLSLFIPVVHCEKSIGESLSAGGGDGLRQALERFQINCQLATYLGAEKMVLHLWNGLSSDQFFDRNLSAYPQLLAIAQRCGIDLTVENVVCAQEDPLFRWRQLLSAYPGAHFTYDTKMAAFHGQIEDMYAPENRFLWTQGHIRHLHLNDYGGGYKDWQNLRTLHPGQGSIDFDRLFTHLSLVNYQGDYTVEATSFLPDGVIHWEDLNRTFAFLRAHQR